MRSYHAVFFDLDGTLMETSIGVVQAIDFIVDEFKLPPLTEAEKRSFIGPPIQRSFKEKYDLDEARAWEIAAAWRNAYKDQFLFGAEPYDGIYDLLKYCRNKGIKTGVATNKREDYTVKLLQHFKFIPLFDYIVGADFDGKRSKSQMIQMCVQKIGNSRPECCLMVGDTEEDGIAAMQAGVDFAGVTYGFGLVSGGQYQTVKPIMLADRCTKIKEALV